MDSLDYKYKHASKQKRIIALQNNRQKPAKQVQKMDDRLGYNAPIEVYDQKFYRYANPNYSITELPLTNEDVRLIDKAVDLLAKAEGQPELQATGRVLKRVRKRLIAILNFG